MGITIQEEGGNLAVMRIAGQLKKSELDAIQADAAKKLGPNDRVKLLIIVDDFNGWEGDVDWGDMSFYAEHGDKIAKIAIVGDPKREADWMMFMGGGVRPSPIKYFSSAQIQQARAWLA